MVYDLLQNTFGGSLDSLQNFGNMVTFGNASGPIPPVDALVMQKGSVTLSHRQMNYTTELANEMGQPMPCSCRWQRPCED